MRGKPTKEYFIQLQHRITPADAGKTQVLADGGNTDEDHPRGCGENFGYWYSWAFYRGSPPRMRGKRLRNAGGERLNRITPADAGKTLTTSL